MTEAKTAIDELRAELEESQEESIELNARLQDSVDYQQELSAQIVEQKIEIDSLKKQLEESTKDNEIIKEESIKGAEVAAEIVAQCGAEEPIEAETAQEQSNDDLWTEYHAISSNADKVAFYRKHRNKLLNQN